MSQLRTNNRAQRKAAQAWSAPPDLDPECLKLCEALNAVPGVRTSESCCGHGKSEFRIWFGATERGLRLVCYAADSCHSGARGWQVIVRTDCGLAPVHYRLEGPAGDYAGAALISEALRVA